MQTVLSRASLLIALTLITSSCATLPTPQPVKQSFQLSDSFLGISHAGYSRSKAELDLLTFLGVGFSRIDFAWEVIQPQPGNLDFSHYDGVVDALASRGIGTLPILDYDVGWIHPDGKAKRRIPPDRMDDWLRYVRGTVSHFKGRVLGWEIWNEPNGPFFWSGSADEFAELTKQTIKAIREVDPEARIIVGSFFRNPVGFARALSRKGAFEGADAISFHPYDLNPERSARLASAFMKELRGMGFGGEFWATEIGFTTEGIYPNQVRAADLPSYVAKSITLLAVAGCSRVVWYALSDRYMPSGEGRDTNAFKNSEDYFGISFPDRSLKPGAAAYSAMAHTIEGSAFDPGAIAVPAGARGLSIFPFRMLNGNLAIVAWADRDTVLESSSALQGYRVAIDSARSVPLTGRTIQLSTVPRIVVLDSSMAAETQGRFFCSFRSP